MVIDWCCILYVHTVWGIIFFFIAYIVCELWTMVFSLFGIQYSFVEVCATLHNVVYLEGTEC